MFTLWLVAEEGRKIHIRGSFVEVIDHLDGVRKTRGFQQRDNPEINAWEDTWSCQRAHLYTRQPTSKFIYPFYNNFNRHFNLIS